jgi:hypothetical protein
MAAPIEPKTPFAVPTRQLSRATSIVHPPDVVAVFDAASVGGGGPLRRISTQQRERVELEARQREARIAAGLPPEGGLLDRFRSGGRAGRSVYPVPLREELSPTTSRKSVVQETKESPLEASEELEPHVYPDGGYGWAVVGCCATLAGLTMGWGMNWGIFQTVSTVWDHS